MISRMPVPLHKRLSSERMGVDTQKRKRQKSKRQKERRQLIQVSSKQFHGHHDPLGCQTPDIGVEALIATIDAKKELLNALKELIKRKSPEKSSHSEKKQIISAATEAACMTLRIDDVIAASNTKDMPKPGPPGGGMDDDMEM